MIGRGLLLALALTGVAQAQPERRETPAFQAIRSTPADPVTALPAAAIETRPVIIQVDIPGDGPHGLQGLLSVPRGARAGDGRPAIVITHGNPRDVTAQRKSRVYRWSWLTEEFARRGYVALAVMRRGFGTSSGTYEEWYGRCKTASAEGYVRGARRGAEDLRAALSWLARDERVDPERLLALGHSGGGFAALALASDPASGLRGVINFAGGRGSNADGQNCNAAGLTGAFHRFGTPGAAPSLWLYARTDDFFWPALVKAHFDGFDGPARLMMFDAALHTSRGHSLFQRGSTALWRPAIDAFLTRIGMPTWATAPPLPDDLDLPPPPGLSADGKTAWRWFLGSEMHRAFATGPDSRYGWASGYASEAEARTRALAACNDQRKACRVVLTDTGR